MAVKPRIKLDKKEAKKGDLVEVKALVSHVMETGAAQGRRRQHRAAQDSEQISLHGRRQAGVCRRLRNGGFGQPYIQFKFKAQESGPVVLTWTDDDGSTIVGEETITVTNLACSE